MFLATALYLTTSFCIYPRTCVVQFPFDLFSSANVAKLEPLVQTCVSKLVLRSQEHQREDKPVDLLNAYRCLATDVITEYALSRSRYMLDSPDFAAGYNRVLRDSSNGAI